MTLKTEVLVEITFRGAIETKYHCPTDTLGGRLSATSCTGKRIYISWDHSLAVDENHAAAAKSMAWQFGWSGKLIQSPTSKGFVHVFKP